MAHEVLAELVGNVLRVEVTPGQVVTPEDPLVVLESMKMEIPVHSERAGTVTAVAVQVGDVVMEGDLLVELT